MRLTRFSDYALRVLMYLGLRPGEIVRIEDIARHYGISENHLMKVVNGLGALGYVRTVRGRGGGLTLARAADAILVGEVVRKTEADSVVVECFDSETNTCPITSACMLRHALSEALTAFYRALDSYTLADLLTPGARLARLLSLPANRPAEARRRHE